MKDRLPALDGLRGFAALSVVLGHAAIWNLAAGLPILPIILIAFSSAHNAVQILFVLSGFLIAYLYPVVPHTGNFIKKRYARIFPIYVLIVFFLWLLTFNIKPWYFELGALLVLACFVHIGWKLLTRHPRLRKIGTIVFCLFIFLQISVLVFHVLYVQRFIVANSLALPLFQQNLIYMLTNITLTHQLVKGIPAMSGVFWSLGAEMLFYILYPFIVVPLIQIARRGGLLVSLLVICAITKILLDLDSAVMSIAGLNGMNIARENGFVAGVTIGTIYQSQGKTWKSIKKVAGNPLFGFIALGILILVQLGEHIVGLGSISFMNIFYLVTSWLLVIVVLTAIIPHSLIHKIFRAKIIVFLGLISYSLYLIHETTRPWVQEVEKILLPFIPSKQAMDILGLFIYISLSVLLSYVLYRTVEFLYFSSKTKTIATTQASYKEKTKNKRTQGSFKINILTVCVVVFAFSLLYSGFYSPTLLIERHLFPSYTLFQKEKSLLKKSIIVPFTSSFDNLSVIGVDMRYGGSAGLTRGSKKAADLKFELLDENKKIIFTSVRHAFEVEGSPRFQFGFPTIEKSHRKHYSAKLTLVNGKKNDDVLIDTSPTSFIAIYKTQRSDLIKNPLQLVINRCFFIMTNPSYLFVLVFLVILVVIASKQSRKKK